MHNLDVALSIALCNKMIKKYKAASLILFHYPVHNGVPYTM